MNNPLTFLFGDLAAAWPADKIQEPNPASGPAASSLAKWLGDLESCIVDVHDLRTAADRDRVAVEARLGFDPVQAYYPEGFPFALTALPEIEFRIQKATKKAQPVRLYAASSDTGAEVLLEGLPLEIKLPWKIIAPHPKEEPLPPGGRTTGEFKEGELDSQRITFGNDGTRVWLYARLRVTEKGEVVITPAVPISFGKCRFLGLPCLAVYDLQLIPSPEIARQHVDWLRHDITPWDGSQAGQGQGAIGARSVYLDPDEEPMKTVRQVLRGKEQPGATSGGAPASLVLDDLVLPYTHNFLVPLPRHLTTGLRRDLDGLTGKEKLWDLASAPVKIQFHADPDFGMLVNSLYYTSQPESKLKEALDPGVGVSVDFYWGKDKDNTVGLTLDENLTPIVSYKRMPAAGGNILQKALTWRICNLGIAIVGIRAGFSFGLAFGAEKRSADSCLVILADLYVADQAGGGGSSVLKFGAGKFELVVQGIGYRFGEFHLEGLKMPDGVQATLGPVVFAIEELGMTSEGGGNYICFSGLLAINRPSGFTGGVAVKRMRIRFAGSESAPAFLLDGIFVLFSTPTITIQAGGYYTERDADGTHLKEFGFGGSLQFSPPLYTFMLSVDLIAGSASGAQDFRYFMFQAEFRGSIPIYCVEINMLRVLFAHNMTPKVKPYADQAYEFRYYNWYRLEADPLSVGVDRRLAAWTPAEGGLAVGAGFGISITGCGWMFSISAFAAYVQGPGEKALLIVIGVSLFKSVQPVAYGVLELDMANGRYMCMIGVDLTLDKVIKGMPGCLKDIAKLTGTIVFGNKPRTFAIGRLNDQRSWLGVFVDIDLWFAKAYLQVAFCLELVEGGDNGTGAIFRFEGGWSIAVVRISFNAGLGWLAASFATGSNDYALELFIEAGVRAVVFWIFRFGIQASADLKVVGNKPSRVEMRLTLTFEMPWFLPDISVTIETSSGEVAPAKMPLFVSPLQAGTATAVNRLSAGKRTNAGLGLHTVRVDPNWPAGGEEVHETYSLEALPGMRLTEQKRFDGFAKAETEGHAPPIPTDSEIALDFSMLVNDLIGLYEGGQGTQQGSQRAGDLDKAENNLTLSYNLVGLRIRRCPRFAATAAWTVVEENREASKSGKSQPQVFNKSWDPDFKGNGSEAATKTLLVNSTTPFGNMTSNPERDEEIARLNPNWPCCPAQEAPRLHRVTFRHEKAGTVVDTPRYFSESKSTLRLIPPAVVRAAQLGGSALPGGTLVAALDLAQPGLLFRAELDEPSQLYSVRMAYRGPAADLELVAFDPQGGEVGRKKVSLPAFVPPAELPLDLAQPFRRVDAWLSCPAWPPVVGRRLDIAPLLEIDEAAYMDIAQQREILLRPAICSSGSADFRKLYEGKGKLFFLPNHEYEIEVTTRLAAGHPSVEEKDAEVQEYVHFKTKGLPGLNAQARVGEELEPYVRGTYCGASQRLYREEPAAVQFHEDYLVAVPLTWRPFGGVAEESDQLFRLALTATPDTAADPGLTFDTTAPDWLTDHRKVTAAIKAPKVSGAQAHKTKLQITHTDSTSPALARLAGLTQRPTTNCPLGDPREVIAPVLLALPQGTADPKDAASELWPASARCAAAVRPEESPWVERAAFEAADASAFNFSADDTGGNGTAWKVQDGELCLMQAGARHFAILGERTWDHLKVQVEVKPGMGTAGVGCGIDLHGDLHYEEFRNPAKANVAERGIFAVIEPVGNGRRLAIYRRTNLQEFSLLKSSPVLPAANQDTFTLVVHVFDDKLRLSVGDVEVEADRQELRAGRLALLGQGGVAFRRLHVEGLPMYAFPFQVSRYRDFAEHIGSFGGTVMTVAAGDMGQGATKTDVAGVWAATGAQIGPAMLPSGGADAREKLFAAWLAGLGLPVQAELTALEITRFCEAGLARCLLIDSPEPLDFAGEVRLELYRRVIVPAKVKAIDLAEVSRVLGRVLAPGAPGASLQPAVKDQPGREGIAGIRRGAGRVRVDLEKSLLAEGGPGAGFGSSLAVVEVEEGTGGHLAARIYRGAMNVSAGGQPFVEASEVSQVTLLPAGGQDDPLAAAGLKKGTVLVADLQRGEVVAVWAPHYAYEPVEIRVLQNGPATRAIVVPFSGGQTAALAPGVYRMDLAIDRKRWITTDPPDAMNSYRATASLTLTL